MNTNYLLPNQYKTIGWILFILGVILGIIYMATESRPDFLTIKFLAVVVNELGDDGVSFFRTIKNNFMDEITVLLLIIGSIFIALSKEKHEDEFIAKIRLESLVWATYFNYFILILTIIFVYELSFFWVMTFNMFTILLFFVIRFNWALYKSKRMIGDEK